MRDLIDREKAIDFLGEEPEVWYGEPEEYAAREQWRADVSAIKAVPTAEPERKTGQWIIDSEGMIHCSECAKIPTNRIRDCFKVLYDIHPLKMNYCPNCGVRMVGEQ